MIEVRRTRLCGGGWVAWCGSRVTFGVYPNSETAMAAGWHMFGSGLPALVFIGGEK